jgi:hypothetical protein
MGLNAVLSLVPNGTQLELILLDSECGLGLGELNVCLPKLLIAPIADIRAQQIGTLGDLRFSASSGFFERTMRAARRSSAASIR